MAWVGIVTLGLIAEVSVIVALGRRTTRRYEIGQQPTAQALIGPRYGASPPQAGRAPTVPPRPRDAADGEWRTVPVPRQSAD
jgi:hypothetical protein